MLGAAPAAAEEVPAIPGDDLAQDHVALDHSYDQAPMGDVRCPVHHENVAWMDAAAQAALLLGLEKEGGCGMGNDQLVQGQTLAPEIPAGC